MQDGSFLSFAHTKPTIFSMKSGSKTHLTGNY
jgi:hypothetical protein